ncbi:MAG: diguanylate cyclase [Phyllobacterium sp.]|uniref:diguanylate cyclase domain-containing protein n=1 Tax=Phyllobacterium sp. TaxID=1871046 RepID=UPI0030F26B4C
MSNTPARSLSSAKTRQLADLVADMIASITRRDDADTAVRIKAELDAMELRIRQQAAALAHSQRIFDQSSAAARIGIWECSLPDETLRWTDVVYDIFDLPRGSPLDRNQILSLYSAESAQELHRRRSRAVEEHSGFTMDAEIITAKGNRRWMRITATVECTDSRPVRIFGMKQDITEQKILLDQTRYLAEYDPMTGLANRSQFQAKLADMCKRHDEETGAGALLLIDLDGFKKVNDTLGHAVGDDCLKEVAQRLANACRAAEIVARIGGDEFAVLIRPQQGMDAAENLARIIVTGLSQPIDHDGRTLRLGASVGIALIETNLPSEVFKRADTALYAAKTAGRNRFQLFEPPRDVNA